MPTKHCFAADGRRSTSPPHAPPITAEASTSFTFDPQNSVPTIGGNVSSSNDIMLQGTWDQRGGPHGWNWQKPTLLSARNDVVVFRSEPLAEDVEATDKIEVKLWISSTAVDTELYGERDRRLPAQSRLARRLVEAGVPNVKPGVELF